MSKFTLILTIDQLDFLRLVKIPYQTEMGKQKGHSIIMYLSGIYSFSNF